MRHASQQDTVPVGVDTDLLAHLYSRPRNTSPFKVYFQSEAKVNWMTQICCGDIHQVQNILDRSLRDVFSLHILLIVLGIVLAHKNVEGIWGFFFQI